MANLSTAGINITVDKQDGRLETKSPLSLRNVTREAITDLAQIQNVVEINKVNNATVQWNSSTNRYEVKPGVVPSNIDGGTF